VSNVGRETAPGGRAREQGNTDREHLAAAVHVAERAAGEEQRGQQERVRFDDPLDVAERRVQPRLYRRQRDVHDGAVDESHAGAEDRRRQQPAAFARTLHSPKA